MRRYTNRQHPRLRTNEGARLMTNRTLPVLVLVILCCLVWVAPAAPPSETPANFAKDVAPLIANSIHLPAAYNQVFNIGADDFYSVNHLAHEVARVMGVEPRLRYVGDRDEVKHAYCSHDKLRQVFAHQPRYSLAEGLMRMAAWVRNHGQRKSKDFKNIEITRNLPAAWRT